MKKTIEPTPKTESKQSPADARVNAETELTKRDLEKIYGGLSLNFTKITWN